MIDKHVCSLALAMKLKELGISKESLCYYLNIDGEGKYYIYYAEYTPEEFEYQGDPIPAFTASELLDMLPNTITLKENEPFSNFRLKIIKSIIVQDNNPISTYIINYYCDSTEIGGGNAWLERKLISKSIYDPNLSNTTAKMLIYLIENKLYDPK